ncbi:uncharacterized protein [Pseudorasbora parva]|uniref:uncharacterized protein isoform X2 n=1 Tax=Pseudorasbora parva TaxID=51549 RepID=UPI00351EEBEC
MQASMSRKRMRCFVVGCRNEHNSRHLLPTSEPLRTQWMSFAFKGHTPPNLPKCVYVCSNHFTPDCFVNEGQYKAGFAKKLFLKDGSVPAVRDPALPPEEVCRSALMRSTRDVGSQTDSPQRHSVGTQLSMRTLQAHRRSTGVQTTVSSTASVSHAAFMAEPPSKRPRMDLEEVGDDEDEVTCDPAEANTSLTEPTEISAQTSRPVQKICKYIVYESCLMALFEACPVCRRSCDVRSQRLGTFLRVDQLCQHCQFSRRWDSQPIVGSIPAGNLHLSAAVYLSGASFYTVEKIFAAMHLQVFKHNTFLRHARMYIEPAIVYKWQNWQDGTLHQISQREKVIVGGDMRAVSPGHTARFGSYAMMDLETNTVVDIQLVQSNEVGGSCNMEKEGLKRSLDLLEAHHVTLHCIVTDRHPQTQKYLSDRNVPQLYDVGHIEKEISERLDKIARLKGCEKLRKWMRSIKHHMYWTAASSATGPERVAKWTSILNHVRDKHTHEDPRFPACLHAQRQSADKSKWLAAGTLPFYKLEKVLSNRRILRDVTKLSPHSQATSAEAFHSAILRFAPKNIVFPFLGLLCRLYLAALHFNENTTAGQPVLKLSFPKAGNGESRPKEVKTEPTFTCSSVIAMYCRIAQGMWMTCWTSYLMKCLWTRPHMWSRC